MTTTSRSVATSIGMITTYEDYRALRVRKRAERASFADDIPRFLVLTKANEFGVPQVVVAGPLEELELADELRLQPLAFRHLRFRQPLAPTTAPRLRQIRKRALVDLESLEFLEQLRTRNGSEAVAGSCDVDQLLALEVPKGQSIERLRSAGVAADHELLTAVDAHLNPRTRAQSRLVHAVAALGNEPFEILFAEEVVQDAWLTVLRSLDRYERRSTFRTWVLGIVVNLARSRAGAERRAVPLSSELAQSVDGDRFLLATHPQWPHHWAVEPTAWRTPEDELLARETRKVILEAIEALPPAQREVVVLRDVEGMPSTEVCNILALTDTHQRVLLHRARSRARNALERYFAATEAT
jgi:RNA polymerase sigma-70 factor (ECF subfamily)